MMDTTLWALLACTVLAFAYSFSRDRHLPVEAVGSAWKTFGGVWPELLLGFLLAGAIDVLITKGAVTGWLKDASGGRDVLIGWAAGLLLPGGPYVAFPIAAALMHRGASPAMIITFITAKTLLSPIRMLTYEAPLLGWPMTLARFIPAILLPPLLGYLGQWLYRTFNQS